jgi:hypothetical protein
MAYAISQCGQVEAFHDSFQQAKEHRQRNTPKKPTAPVVEHVVVVPLWNTATAAEHCLGLLESARFEAFLARAKQDLLLK